MPNRTPYQYDLKDFFKPDVRVNLGDVVVTIVDDRTIQFRSAKPTPEPSQTDEEHYLRAGQGTQTTCSCGKSFALYSDAEQHTRWQLETQQLIQADRERLYGELETRLTKASYSSSREGRIVNLIVGLQVLNKVFNREGADNE